MILLLLLSTIPAVVSWVPYLSWCRYAFGILVVDQWQHISVLGEHLVQHCVYLFSLNHPQIVT